MTIIFFSEVLMLLMLASYKLYTNSFLSVSWYLLLLSNKLKEQTKKQIYQIPIIILYKLNWVNIKCAFEMMI